MKEAEISKLQADFLRAGIAEDFRMDGRPKEQFRPFEVKLGQTSGHAEVRMGFADGAITCVLGVVAADTIEPRRDRPSEGRLTINVELSPAACHAFAHAHAAGRLRQNEHRLDLQRSLEVTIRDSRAVDLDSLCIISGKMVWHLKITVHVIDHGGNLFDASALAALVALKHFRRPDVTITGENFFKVHSIEDRPPIPLHLHHMPFSLTFALFSDADQHVVWVFDPSSAEEQVMDGRVTMSIAILDPKEPQLCALQKVGAVMDQELLLGCVQRAEDMARELNDYVEKVLEDEKARVMSELLEVKQRQLQADAATTLPSEVAV